MQKLLPHKHSMKAMLACVALVALGAIVAISASSYFVLFIIPCMLMLGVMIWMMAGPSHSE